MRAILLLLLGLIVGILGAILQAQRLHVGSLWIPTGFVLALAVLIPIARAAAWWIRSRIGAIYLGVGWLIGTLAMGTSSPWGDLVLTAGTRQVAYLVIGAMLLTVAATIPLSDPSSGPLPEPASTLGERGPHGGTETFHAKDYREPDSREPDSREPGPATPAYRDHRDA